MSVRARMLTFIGVLLVDAALGLGQFASVAIACAAYLVLVLPVLGR